ncbi:MAG: MarR family transcriptional regulator [Pseudomonadota bacterium]
MNTDAVIQLASQVRERANALIVAELERRGAAGLAPSHGAILVQLYRQGPLPMHRLARLIGRKKNTVTSLVGKLESLGYVSRQADPGDSRVTLVAPTDKASAFRTDFEEISCLLLRRAWGGMPPDQREALVRGLEQMAENLR